MKYKILILIFFIFSTSCRTLKPLHTELLDLRKVNKLLRELIKGLQIELSELKNSQKEWK